jgi:hypothetical protein
MGLALGGITSPYPRMMYGVQGDASPLTITKGGYGATNILKVCAAYYVPAATASSFTIRINDGADHDYTVAIGVPGTTSLVDVTLYFSNGKQVIYSGNSYTVTPAISTDAISPVNIVSISGLASAVNCRALTVEVFDAP